MTGVLIAGTLAVVRHAWRRFVTPSHLEIMPFHVVATVHFFWLCAAPILLLLARRALVPAATRRDRVWLSLAVVVTLIGEPIWTWMVVQLAHYEAYLRYTISGRSDLNAMVVVLLIGLELTELRIETAREQLAQHARLLRSVAEAQLAALTLHLQPHFLFNTLQLVAECARTDGEQAARVVRALRRLLAESARHTARRVVTATEEIDFIRAYLSIQLTRFEERLQVEIDLDPKAAHAAVPHMLLQPVVENAIQHGIGRQAQGGTISVIVRAIEEGTRLLVLVRDDGPGPANELRMRGRQGRGMTNTRARLAAMYGDDFVFGLRQIGHQGAETRIDIPLREVHAAKEEDGATEQPPMTPPLPHRAWLVRLALLWTLLLLIQPAILMLVARAPAGAKIEPLRLLFTSQLRELPFYLLAFAVAELIERIRGGDVQRGWVAGLHLLGACAVLWAHEILSPIINRLVGPDLAMETGFGIFGLRVFLVYGATVVFAHAHMLTKWVAARSGVVRDVTEALEDAERDVCRAQVHQPAVLASLRALEESCDESPDAVDALDLPDHDVEAELRIADAFCEVFGLDGTVFDVTDDQTLGAVVPPGTLATAIASLGARPVERPLIDARVTAARLELGVALRTSGVVSELAAFQRTLNGAVRGGVTVRRQVSGTATKVELSLPLLRASDFTPDVTSDVLLSA